MNKLWKFLTKSEEYFGFTKSDKAKLYGTKPWKIILSKKKKFNGQPKILVGGVEDSPSDLQSKQLIQLLRIGDLGMGKGKNIQ